MSIQFEKTDKTCNNIYLIDERLCLSDSFNILNFNFNTLSANTDILMDFSNQFNSLYTYFAQNSADWSLGSANTLGRKSEYNSMYSCVTSTSAKWIKEFSVIYPYILEINDYYSNIVSYKQTIKDWLLLNFSPQNYCLSQEVMVYINLYQIDTFTFSFSGKYEEKCLPVVQPKQICCSGNQCGNLHRGCNLNEGGRHFCINAYSRCATNITTSCSTGSCPSTGSKLLKLLQVSNTYNDTYTARCFKFKYKKESEGDWTLQI
jgi:hypothetical protein